MDPRAQPPGWVLEWRWLAVLGCVPPSFMLLLMCFMPETPRFLLSQHKHQEAMAAMQFLWGYAQGWEEPPLGAQHQVRGWEPARGEGDPGESPLWFPRFLLLQPGHRQPSPRPPLSPVCSEPGVPLFINALRPPRGLARKAAARLPGISEQNFVPVPTAPTAWGATLAWVFPRASPLLPGSSSETSGNQTLDEGRRGE